MHVVFVEAAPAFLLELNLQFRLPALNRFAADGAGGADAWTSPRSIRAAGWEFAAPNRVAGLSA